MGNSAARYDTPSLREHLARLAERDTAGRFAEMPPISEAFVHKCLMDMCTLGLIDPAR